jgi:transposase-like protein
MTTPDQDQNRPQRRGRPLTQERATYFALVNEGVGFREAARQVGVDYRLTKRWRTSSRPAPPEPEPPAISPRFLSQDERLMIADRLRAHTSVRSIARELRRPASTISREKHRNQQPDGTYQPYRAHALAHTRRARPKTAHSPPTRSCGRSSRMGWTSGGVRSRSPAGCAATTPTGRSGT